MNIAKTTFLKPHKHSNKPKCQALTNGRMQTDIQGMHKQETLQHKKQTRLICHFCRSNFVVSTRKSLSVRKE